MLTGLRFVQGYLRLCRAGDRVWSARIEGGRALVRGLQDGQAGGQPHSHVGSRKGTRTHPRLSIGCGTPSDPSWLLLCSVVWTTSGLLLEHVCCTSLYRSSGLKKFKEA
ncbi:uncharacterized protein LOC119306060 [Triticum dicoccoides]|uniref:uncharacterized protein LOC119306060 n=1 Tax=Triticum dicoccoides TaxID=85692 RepID=UPI00188EE933|nr:uncharacterized protein LOC119306060 [Triticum dicoccoides]